MGEPLSDAQVNAALGCDCIADLRAGACGAPLVEAFGCYLCVGGRARGGMRERLCVCVCLCVCVRACVRMHSYVRPVS